MIRNYLLVVIRNLRRQLVYSTINILGLAIGFACSLVMFLYVYGEWSYDRHHANADRIYKVGVSFFNIGNFGIGPEALGEYLPKEFEGVEAFTRVKRSRSLPVYVGDRMFKELGYYTDTAFFRIFSYEFVQGNPATALKDPSSLVMTQSMALKFFGDVNALGKTLEISKEKKIFNVTGIVRDDPRSSQLKAKLWLSIENELEHSPHWSSAAVYNYVMLKEHSTRQDLDAALDRVMLKQVYPKASGVPQGISFEDYKKHENSIKFLVHSLKEVHLKSNLNYEISAGGSEANMYTFTAISVFILLLASVNFINLTTARASRRAKEVGIRKVVGSSRKKLVGQFMLESTMICTLAFAFALILAEMFLKIFEVVTGSPLIHTLWSSPVGILMLVAFAILVGLISGIYPAFYLTSFRPVKVLKGDVSAGGAGFRNVLVVAQFSISICLMICAAIIVSQMNFLETKELGFNQDNVVTIDDIDKLGTSAGAFKEELSNQSGVALASFHTGEPGSKAVMSFYTYKTPAMTDAITVNTYFGDHEYIRLMGFKMLKGREFDKNLASDSTAVILNESAVKALGLEDPIGAIVNADDGWRVIGVVSDFHWESFRSPIAPVAFKLNKHYFQLAFRLNSASAGDFVAAAEAKWKQFVPDEPLPYHFLDDNFGDVLNNERVFGKAIGFFTALAIFISCLGLYGLSAYTAEQRTREIGIRKVMGASMISIVTMLNRRFALLVFVAMFFAIPISVFVMLRWLEGFAYRIDLNVWLFLGVAASAIVIALLTVSYHSLKAALVNPAETLKYE